MNCNNQPKCEKPCGDCTQEWPVPAGGEVDPERVQFEAWAERECGTGSTERWLGTEAYTNTRVQDYWTGWLAALQSQQPAGWRPIETVPSGTMVLLADMNATEARHWAFVDWIVRGKCCGNMSRTATHWMPLPPAPGSAGAAPVLKRLSEEQIQQARRHLDPEAEDIDPFSFEQGACWAESALAEANGAAMEDQQ